MDPKTGVRIRPTRPTDRDGVRAFTIEQWCGEFVTAHGTVYYPDRLPGFVAEDSAGEILGLVTYSLDGGDCEVATLNAVQQRVGIGTALFDAVAEVARGAGCRRLWLMSTNDNVEALAFYEKRGMRLTAVHRDAVARSRKLKPAIPLAGRYGIPICDEWELELSLIP